jgi:hypothetical protein
VRLCYNATWTRGPVQTRVSVKLPLGGRAVVCIRCNICTADIGVWWLEFLIPGEYKSGPLRPS